jgi:hypothetical protein
MICAPWLCACDKHGSVTELDFQFNCFILLPRLFSNLVSNESVTDMADAARQARQGKARQGKAKWGLQSVFQTPFLSLHFSRTRTVDMCSRS